MKSALIVGASRGLGLGIARELIHRDWNFVATARGQNTKLQELSCQVEMLDIDDSSQIAALKTRLGARSFDILFVNAGIASPQMEPIGDVSTDEFVRVMTTNALSVMRVVETLADNVSETGTIGVMSSGQGSVADNEGGGYELYRASKAALNMLMRSFAARRGGQRSLLLLAPGWVQTDMGGPGAKFSLDEVIEPIVDTITGQSGKSGLRYLDRFGEPIRW